VARRRELSQVHTRTRRRLTSWEEGPGGVTITQLVNAGVSFLGSVVQPTQDGLTIIRTRGQFTARLVVPSSDGFIGAIGIAVATTAAIAAGIASVPTPIIEQSWDGWLYWSSFWIHGESAADLMASWRVVVDSKAMRKIREEEALYAAVQLSTEQGTGTLDMSLDSRILLKLP